MSNTGENIYERRDGRWEGRYICGRKPDGARNMYPFMGGAAQTFGIRSASGFERVRRNLRRTAPGHPF